VSVVDFEELASTVHAAADEAAKRVLDAAGVDAAPAVVVNVAWRENDGHEFAVGTRVPDDSPAILADSLHESATEVT
jgi:hypothetical protein